MGITYKNIPIVVSGFKKDYPRGFPSTIVGDCQGAAVSTAEWASLGDTFICIATDIDGDGFINAVVDQLNLITVTATLKQWLPGVNMLT